jgi:polyphosphate kinase
MNQVLTAPSEIGEPVAERSEGPQFLNRDLSWLEFNRRVLHEALDDRTPLLERLRFLGIFTSNLDEFFMKRLATLRHQAALGSATLTPDGRTPGEVLAAVRNSIQPMLERQARCFEREIRPRLAASGIHLLAWRDLTAAEREKAHEYFQASVFPVLTPLAVDPGSPFPFIQPVDVAGRRPASPGPRGQPVRPHQGPRGVPQMDTGGSDGRTVPLRQPSRRDPPEPAGPVP